MSDAPQQPGPGTEQSGPRGEMIIRVVAMPADTNPAGDIFGGWIMGMMDLAAGSAGTSFARGRVVTAAVSNLSFLQPVKVGDNVCVYAHLDRTGRTSLTIGIEVWVVRPAIDAPRVRVTEAKFVMVAVDKEGRPRQMQPT